VFALTSREDPFPLVALEAASMEKPIIFFENAGGIPELFTNDKGGMQVSFGNIEEMALAILYLYDNPEIRIKKGKEAAKLTKDYDIDIIGQKIEKVIDDFI
jgi:glycosyltransferase involved in cell wall biosynthesis